MKYVYPAIFTPAEDIADFYVVEFPDIELAVTQGRNFSDAYHMAEDVLSLALMKMENADEKIPAPTALDDLSADGDKLLGLVEADTDAYRKIFQSGNSLHETWYSPITNRNFFVAKRDDDNVCKRVAELLEKISGVNMSKFYE